MDTFLTNAWVYTPEHDFRHGSVFVRGDRIAQVLYDDDDPTYPGANKLETVDLDDQYLLPGFVDTHIHLTSIALKGARCDLSKAESADDVAAMLGEWAREHAPPQAVMGVEWDESRWADPSYPTRAMLDAIDNTRCILARRICGHLGVANTVLLERLSHPGSIDTETGLVHEHALWEAGRLCEPDLATLHDGLETAIRSLHALGITTIHDIVEPAKIDRYLEGVRRSSVPLRIDMLVHEHPGAIEALMGKTDAADNEFIRLAGVKCFLDGSLGGRTAALNAPYLSSGEEQGTLFLDDDELRSIVRGCHDRGVACAMHAIGDRAIDQAANALAELPGETQGFRIEHGEIVGKQQLEALKRVPVFLAMQPNFVRNWGHPGGIYEQRLGKVRARECNPWASLREAGIPFVFGSDGMPPGPLYGIRGATEHPNEAQRIDIRDALDRYTRLAHYLGHHKRDAGTIGRGQLADIVVLDRNPLEAPLDRISVAKTIVGGEVVYDSGAAGS